MGLHPDFPQSPFAIVQPEHRWFPADENLRATSYESLLPPLVPQLRREVRDWRDRGYTGAAPTSRELLRWWFDTPHWLEQEDGSLAQFQYYFAQREAVETVIYLHDVVGVQDKYDLMRYDRSGLVSTGMFDETWRRFVIKMATGAGKTKVLSLLLAWCYFHRLYEPDSDLARNFLLIAPNIIVLDRLRKDFEGLRIYAEDPILPDNGVGGCDWQDDFQLVVHLQDDVRVVQGTGNLFLTNIHRVYAGDDTPPSAEDEDTRGYFLGAQPVTTTNQSMLDLGAIVRDIDELVVLNDEAHHIHDPRMAWFKSIQDIDAHLRQKGGRLALQIDVTATPKHNNGAIFVQTVADYPLVEAIEQNVVKHPVLPDAASRAKLHERQSSRFVEQYADYIKLGLVEWQKVHPAHSKEGKKAILFVMTDDTRNCDEVGDYLQKTCPELEGAVLVIHTKQNGDISEASSGKSAEALVKLRRQANEIDSMDSPFRAIVSVMMLKEGWDVQNVTTIVGLRAYSAKSNILPEQTLGRGLRKMYPGFGREEISVVGTDAFMDFVESIQNEGITLERRAMGEGVDSKTPLIIEVGDDKSPEELDRFDIELPVLTPRLYREYKNLEELDIDHLTFQAVNYLAFSPEQQREIVFRDITTGEIAHVTELDDGGYADGRSVIGYFARSIMHDLRLVGGYDVLYGQVKAFVQHRLFVQTVDLDDPNTLRNLSEPAATRTILTTFKDAINDLTITDRGTSQIRDTIKLRKTRPFIVQNQEYVVPKKSVFNRIVGDSHLELRFAAFLDDCPDVVSYAKNYFAVGFRLDYVNASGDIVNYYPDFMVKLSDRRIVIVETKGLEDLDVPLKTARLRQWCEDINRVQSDVEYDFVYVDQESFEKYQPSSFRQLLDGFREYKEEL